MKVPPMWSNFIVEWKAWWRSTSWAARFAPLVAASFHLGLRASFRELVIEDLFFAAIFLFTYYGLPAKRSPFSFWLPLYCGWMAHLVFVAAAGRFPHFTGKESLEIDRRFLSFVWEDKSVTVPEFLSLWVKSGIAPVLEKTLIAVPLVALAYSAALRFYYSRKGTARYSAWGIDTLSSQMNWAIVMAWAGSHFGFPSLYVALMTIVVYYAFKFGAQRSPALIGLVLVALVSMLAGRSQSVDVIFGVIEGLGLSYIADMVAYEKPRRHAQKIWNPSVRKKDLPPPSQRKVG